MRLPVPTPDPAQIRIARDFTLAEVLRSRAHPELQTTPDQLTGQQTVNFMRLTHEFLQPARNRLDHRFIMNSWLRSEALDRVVTDGKVSRMRRHLLGLAADFYVHDIPAQIMLRTIARNPEDLVWDRLCLYSRENRLHVDTCPWEEGPPRKLFYIDWVEVSIDLAIQFSTAGLGPSQGGGTP